MSQRIHKCNLSDEALMRLQAVCTAALQVKQPNVSREVILQTLNEIPVELLLQVSEDLKRIQKGEETIL